MSDYRDLTLRQLNDCGCCEGIEVDVPQPVMNRPGLMAIAYRIGTHSQFKASLLTRLSTLPYPVLKQLTTREDDDFAIALLDAWATVADVLTFYQERIANESYLRTATERQSLVHLAWLIGYQPSPGVAASTHLVFTLEAGPRSPQQVMIEIGTKVQSLPGPGEDAQFFETVEAIEARPQWNVLKPRTTQLPTFELGKTSVVYLQETNTQLKPGDALLFVGLERERDKESDRWDFRKVKHIQPDPDHNHTYIELDRPLGSLMPRGAPAANPKVYALRQRAALFGHNAPDPRILPREVTSQFAGSDLPIPDPPSSDPPVSDWLFTFPNGTTVDLETTYPKLVVGSWVVLVKGSFAELYRITALEEASQRRYTLSNKTTRLTLSGEHLDRFEGTAVRSTVVFGQSEELPIADPPYTQPLRVNDQVILSASQFASNTLTPITGKSLELNQPVASLTQGRTLMISGKPIRVRVNVNRIRLTTDTGEFLQQLPKDTTHQVLSAPTVLNSRQLRWQLKTDDGRVGYATVSTTALVLTPASAADAPVAEAIAIKQISDSSNQLVLETPLQHWYDRATVSIHGNVAFATHGETKEEILGSGDVAQAFQTFSVRNQPITQINAPTATGVESTLEVRVNDIRWQEVPLLYGQGNQSRVFTTQRDETGKTTLHFGDGDALGTRLPTGIESVRAKYRQGLGVVGNVKADQLSLLLKRPLGVKSCTNPNPATGGADPSDKKSLRQEVPTTVLTLGRIVSRQDYEDFARSFAGIAKAIAVEINSVSRTIGMTVAGANGQPVTHGSDLYNALLQAIGRNGAPFVTVQLTSYRPMHFRLVATLQVKPDYLPTQVLETVQRTLKETFSFEARALGQGIARSEVIAVIQAVEGVIAVDLDRFHRVDQSPSLQPLLRARFPQPGVTPGRWVAAELLLLDESSLEAVEVQP